MAGVLMLQSGGKMKYKIVSKGYNHRKMIPFTEDVSSHVANPNDAYYESIFTYDESHKKQFEEKKSAAGLTGLTTKKLIFDFDSKEDLEKARKDAVELTARLIQKGLHKDIIAVYHSGSKGFHIELKTNDEFTKPQFDSTIDALAGDLETFDKKVRDENRIFRVALTKHPETGKFKIPLTVDQLTSMPIDAIQAMSEKVDDNWEKWQDLVELYSNNVVQLPDSIKQFKTLSKKEKKTLDEIPVSLNDTPNLSNKPKHMSSARFVLQEGFFNAGERNEAYMILAATYKSLGYNKELAYNMLKATNRLQARRTGQEPKSTDELWINVIEVVYSPTWRGAIYSEKENDLLKKVIAKYNLQTQEEDASLVSLSDMSGIFKNFAENIDSNTIKLGIPELDENLRITTSMLVCLLAAPSAGKSTVSFGILNTLSKESLKAFFFSLDMGAPLVYQRLIQRHTGDSGDAIFDNYKKSNERTREYEKTLASEYKNVKFCFRSGLTVDNIRDSLLKEKEATGELPKLVLVDYLECVDSPFSDPTQAKGYVAKRLKDVANEFNICVLLLVQPAKVSGDPSMELTSYTQIKGSSVIQEAASVILTLSRPGFDTKNPENDKYATFTVVKNRMGGLGSFDLGWDGLTGRISRLLDDDKEELNNYRKNKRALQNETGDIF
jgi:hypothetical protein